MDAGYNIGLLTLTRFGMWGAKNATFCADYKDF
jgi:hypothetical protein